MNFDITEFINDKRTMEYSKCVEKYNGKIPKNITLSGMVNQLKTEMTLEKIVDEWFDVYRCPSVEGHFLFKMENGKFEVFWAERGGKHSQVVFSSLEEAAMAKLDLFLNECGFHPKDTIFFKKYISKS